MKFICFLETTTGRLSEDDLSVFLREISGKRLPCLYEQTFFG